MATSSHLYSACQDVSKSFTLLQKKHIYMYLVESEKSKNFSFQFGHFQYEGHIQGVHKKGFRGLNIFQTEPKMPPGKLEDLKHNKTFLHP